MSSAAFAQGTVNWGTISAAAMTADTNGTEVSPLWGGGTDAAGGIGPVAPAGAYYFELLYAPYTGVQAPVPDSLAALLSWSDTGLEAQSAQVPGRLTPINPNAGATVPWSPGTTDSIVLVGWAASMGSSWSDVESGLEFWGRGYSEYPYLGFSATGYITPLPTTTSPGADVFGTGPTAQGLPIFSPNTVLYGVFVPEPGTLALSGLGGLSFLLLRRRR